MRLPPPPEPHLVIDLADISPLQDEELEQLLLWVDSVPLSRKKRHLRRDFADGVMVAEIINFFLPKIIDVHNYSTSNSVKAKEENWQHLNRKVLCRLGVELSAAVVRDLCLSRADVAEHFLRILRERIDVVMATTARGGPRIDPALVRWMSRPPRGVQEGSPQTQRKVFQTLEEFYLSKGLKIFPEEAEDHITNSTNLSPRQKKSILKLTEMVPREELTAREAKVAEKQATIKALYGQIRRLEHLLEIKDIRIDDLSQRLEKLEGRGADIGTQQGALEGRRSHEWTTSTPSPRKHAVADMLASPRKTPRNDLLTPRKAMTELPAIPPTSTAHKSFSLTSSESEHAVAPPVGIMRRPMAAVGGHHA